MNDEFQNGNDFIPTPDNTPIEQPMTAADAAAEEAQNAANAAADEAARVQMDYTMQESEEPQIIIQKERGFAHYVGFALLCVLCIIFYFLPGVALTFAISLIPGISLGAVAAWTFSALLSVIAWVIFKIKIKGFKKSFFFYIGLCVAVFAILLAIEVLTENYNLFANIFAMLFGAS